MICFGFPPGFWYFIIGAGAGLHSWTGVRSEVLWFYLGGAGSKFEAVVSLSRKCGFVFDLRLHVTLNFMCLSCSTLLSSSLLRTDTIIFAKLNKPPLSINPISNVLEINKHPRVLNRGFTVQFDRLSPSNVLSYLHMWSVSSGLRLFLCCLFVFVLCLFPEYREICIYSWESHYRGYNIDFFESKAQCLSRFVFLSVFFWSVLFSSQRLQITHSVWILLMEPCLANQNLWTRRKYGTFMNIGYVGCGCTWQVNLVSFWKTR